MRGERLPRFDNDPDRDGTERELARLRAELARRDDELAQLHLALRTHNELGDRLGALDAAQRGLQAQLLEAQAEARSLADALARERRRRTSATLLARLSEAAAQTDGMELTRLEQRLEASRMELERVMQALADAERAREQEVRRADEHRHALLRDREEAAARLHAAGEALQTLGHERDGLAGSLREALRRRRLEAFADWMLRPRVAAGLVRRGPRGASAAMRSALASHELLEATSPQAVSRLAQPGTIVLLLLRTMVSGHARAHQAVIFRLTAPGE